MSDVDYQSTYSEQYRTVNVAGIFGGIIPGGAEAIIYSEERRIDKAIAAAIPATSRMYVKRTVEFNMIINPSQMKAIHKWLGDRISQYEQVFGNIPSPEEVDSRTRRHPQQ
ncbi:MAG: hypothetical protein E6L03_09160 [Thaumarchaeota archaeon]|nr:MAG: hypothetical protein E6L03_09160 [Nitrososphaerota archaeon]